jgi:hypothetical protein
MGEMRNAHKNFKKLKETGCEDVEWIYLPQAGSVSGFVNTVMNVEVP